VIIIKILLLHIDRLEGELLFLPSGLLPEGCESGRVLETNAVKRFLFFFTCSRSVLVEVSELSVVHASVHIVYTRTFSSLLWINTSGELYRLPYKTASSNGDCWKIRSIVSVKV
jgi:hypothetical protein